MTVLDALVRGFRDSLEVVPYGGGELVSLPTTFSSGAMLSVLVTIDGGIASVTDRGLAADELTDAGVDLQSSRVFQSFSAVRGSTGLVPMFGAEPFEISASVDVEDVAIAIQAIADAAMRADGLRVLSATTRAVSFADRSIERVNARTPVIPRAPMLGRHGEKRVVTFSYTGRGDVSYYVQALSGKDPDARSRSYDHASGLFLGALPEKTHRIALLQDAKWEPWRVDYLQELCRTVDENDIDDFVDSTATAA